MCRDVGRKMSLVRRFVVKKILFFFVILCSVVYAQDKERDWLNEVLESTPGLGEWLEESNKAGNYYNYVLGETRNYVAIQHPPVELWNGLMTGMTKEEVKAILAKAANINLADGSQFRVSWTRLVGINAYYLKKYIEFNGYDPQDNAVPFECLYFFSRNEEFCRYDFYAERNFTDKELSGRKLLIESDANIICLFYEGKLFAILVNWAMDENSLKNKVEEQFGNPIDSVGVYSELPQIKVYIYKGADADTYIAIGNGLKGGLVYGTKSGSKYFVVDAAATRRIKRQWADGQSQK